MKCDKYIVPRWKFEELKDILWWLRGYLEGKESHDLTYKIKSLSEVIERIEQKELIQEKPDCEDN